MTWTRYSAWSRVLFFPGFAVFIACAAAPAQRGFLSWVRCLGWWVGIIILLSGLPVIIKQLVRYEPSVGLPANVPSLGWQGLSTGAAGLFLVLIGLMSSISSVEPTWLNPWIEVVTGGILLMLGVLVTAVWRARRNQEKRIRRAGVHTNSVDLH